VNFNACRQGHGVRRVGDHIEPGSRHCQGRQRRSAAGAIPHVSIEKTARFLARKLVAGREGRSHIMALIERNLRTCPCRLCGRGHRTVFPHDRVVNAALNLAVVCGYPWFASARQCEGFAPPQQADWVIWGSNLTSTKARLLLMACLMRFGAFPPASDPHHPTETEWTPFAPARRVSGRLRHPLKPMTG